MRISDWSSDVCSSDLLDQYRALVAAGELRPDPDQAAAAERLDDLAVQMAAMPKRRGFVARLLGKGAPPPRGLYLWGSVGRGKSMLMDLFPDCVDFEPKRRVHFHEIGRASCRERVCPYV